ncbi:hypothetical protein CC80DRAFT_487213 [Byssothecium circinans]|uniref:SRPBCC domain-containing protein n=1 Tax=Byssothecium circinans TaxID=147558 RepID=A0A6A5UC25_9PLEO|nr:hypothetical protein CC80DRAFT_487213 [Byssothecium circinans]
MGQKHSISTTIEIASPPETVRAVFMDWQNFKTWNQRMALTPLEPSDRAPADLQPGDKIKVDLKGTVFRPVVVENSPGAFKWLGSLYGLFDGQHEFYWKKSSVTPGGTTFVQQENFTGPLSWFVRDGSSGGTQTKTNFEGLNQELKAESEKRAKSSA